MSARQTSIGGRFLAVERGLWPKFDGWPFRRELEELERLRAEKAQAEKQCPKN